MGALHGVDGHFDLVPPPAPTGFSRVSLRIGIGASIVKMQKKRTETKEADRELSTLAAWLRGRGRRGTRGPFEALSNQYQIGGFIMDWDRVEGNWKQMKGKVKEQWGKLTDDDLDVINGKREQLEGRLQQRYGYGKDQAQKEINDWYGRQGW
jgi:uncharacterized protein YjbJ (UPF0337 family)